MVNINYKQSMKKILSEIADMELTENGMEIMNILIDSLNSRLVNYCLENANGGMNIVTARRAVDELFTGNLKRLALVEGNKNLMLYNNELIKYKPHYPVAAKRKKKTKIFEALEFADGVSDLTSSIFPEASLQDQTKKILCELLEELAIKISDFVQSKRSDSITLEDIRAAVIQLLPPELSNHALVGGARTATLFETERLQVTVRKRPSVKEKPKRVIKRAVKPAPKKPKITRKRKHSPSVGKPPSPKRRRMPSARKVSRKKTSPKISQRRTKPKVSRKPVSRKRAPSRKVRPKITSKKRVSKKPARPKISRKKRVTKEAPKKVSRKKSTKRTPSSKKHIPSKKKTVVKKRPIRVPPKTVKRISKKKPTKKKLVSEKVTLRGIAPATTKEINQGTRKLNKSFRQKLPTESLRLANEFISNLLDRLIEEMGKLKSSVIGPEEVRRAVMKVFPPNLADLTIANLSRVLMT